MNNIKPPSNPNVLNITTITNLCNFNCFYCNRHTNKIAEANEMSLEKIIDKVNNHPDNFIILGGGCGDPLMHSNIESICEYLIDNQFEFALYTNGSLKKKLENIIAILNSNKYFKAVMLSAHPYMREIGKGTELDEIINLLQKNNIWINASYIVAPDSSDEILSQHLNYFKEKDINYHLHFVVNNETGNHNLSLYDEDFLKLLESKYKLKGKKEKTSLEKSVCKYFDWYYPNALNVKVDF